MEIDFSPGERKRRTIKKRCKSGIYVEDISLQDLLQHVHLPSNKAARALGVGITVFKKLCRRRGIEKWPYQKSEKTEMSASRSTGDSGSEVCEVSPHSSTPMHCGRTAFPRQEHNVMQPDSPSQAGLDLLLTAAATDRNWTLAATTTAVGGQPSRFASAPHAGTSPSLTTSMPPVATTMSPEMMQLAQLLHSDPSLSRQLRATISELLALTPKMPAQQAPRQQMSGEQAPHHHQQQPPSSADPMLPPPCTTSTGPFLTELDLPTPFSAVAATGTPHAPSPFAIAAAAVELQQQQLLYAGSSQGGVMAWLPSFGNAMPAADKLRSAGSAFAPYIPSGAASLRQGSTMSLPVTLPSCASQALPQPQSLKYNCHGTPLFSSGGRNGSLPAPQPVTPRCVHSPTPHPQPQLHEPHMRQPRHHHHHAQHLSQLPAQVLAPSVAYRQPQTEGVVPLAPPHASHSGPIRPQPTRPTYLQPSGASPRARGQQSMRSGPFLAPAPSPAPPTVLQQAAQQASAWAQQPASPAELTGHRADLSGNTLLASASSPLPGSLAQHTMQRVECAELATAPQHATLAKALERYQQVKRLRQLMWMQAQHGQQGVRPSAQQEMWQGTNQSTKLGARAPPTQEWQRGWSNFPSRASPVLASHPLPEIARSAC